MGSYSQFYQGTNVEFGKNRVQYRDFDWFYYPGDHFDVYYYIGGEPLANYTLRSCENNLGRIQKFYDFVLDDRIQVVSYLKQSEFRQNNVGISNDDQYNIGGTARIMGNKMFIYYEGNHAALEKQIRENLSKVIFNQMMYGGDWKEVLKSSTLLSMPTWYEDGIIHYAANGENKEAEVFMKDLVLSGKFRSLNRLYGNDASLGGQAFWRYIAEVYGENVVPNILYMSRVSRNVESGFLFVLGLSVDAVTKDFINYYKDKYGKSPQEKIPGSPELPTATTDKQQLKKWRKEQKMMGDLKVRYKKKYSYSQFRLSPDGKHIAYVSNELGQYKIWLYDVATGKTRRILKREYRIDRIIDDSFPVLSWHPTSSVLTYIIEKRGRAFIGNYYLEEKRHSLKELFHIEKVLDMDYSKDGKKIIFSGATRGHTDLYLYQVVGNNQEQLTNDVFDDLQPRFIEDDARIIFASNRYDDTLRKDVPIDLYPMEKDIYIFDLNDRKEKLERITATASIDEHHPAGYSHRHFTYLANSSGTDNRYLATVDSAISAIDTTIHYRYFTRTSVLSNFTRSPKDYQFNKINGNYSLLFREKNRPILYIGNKEEDRVLSTEQSFGDSQINDDDEDVPDDMSGEERLYPSTV
ncbi:MAG: PD40 domain-containing protein, partial [Crocinitomicaceae bacterium]|nr:PD40 domain-containing protein [Crocinitomicaceae bacterium]